MKVAKVPARPTPAERPKIAAPQASASKPEAVPAVSQTVNRAWFVVLLVVGVLLLGSTAAIAYGHTMPSWEHSIFTAINGVSLPHWVTSQLAKPISDAVYGILALIVVLLIIPKYRTRAWQYAVAGGSVYVFTFIVEHIIDRARPAGLTHDVVLRASQGGAGFPSGHVATLAALCLTAWFFVSWPWRIGLVILVGAEAWSRMFLGVHAPLDTVGALGSAFIVVAVLHLAPVKLRKLFFLD
ncbi:MAG TPA: phosphatase PAP2 family protein [Candidatus Saccharimonadales bacterium]|jgi:membrane-associated phospholipid phosphatase|nr:phosphatase PAP2 family protein [Candidatus Saccharimonadales bacterium]